MNILLVSCNSRQFKKNITPNMLSHDTCTLNKTKLIYHPFFDICIYVYIYTELFEGDYCEVPVLRPYHVMRLPYFVTLTLNPNYQASHQGYHNKCLSHSSDPSVALIRRTQSLNSFFSICHFDINIYEYVVY